MNIYHTVVFRLRYFAQALCAISMRVLVRSSGICALTSHFRAFGLVRSAKLPRKKAHFALIANIHAGFLVVRSCEARKA